MQTRGYRVRIEVNPDEKAATLVRLRDVELSNQASRGPQDLAQLLADQVVAGQPGFTEELEMQR
jgi:hypothetical protein